VNCLENRRDKSNFGTPRRLRRAVVRRGQLRHGPRANSGELDRRTIGVGSVYTVDYNVRSFAMAVPDTVYELFNSGELDLRTIGVGRSLIDYNVGSFAIRKTEAVASWLHCVAYRIFSPMQSALSSARATSSTAHSDIRAVRSTGEYRIAFRLEVRVLLPKRVVPSAALSRPV
jgi:hypothetical protein